MSLTFLVPLFLVGIAGVVVPIVVHLTRRQRRNVVAFPSLMFLEKIPFQEQRRRRIQHWFLLSLRALALALLAIAFARPFMDNAAIGAGGSSGPRELVVLLDQSYSMGVGTQLDDGVRAARTAIENLGPLDRASLVFFSEGARVVSRSTSDRLRLNGALDTVTAGSGATRYGPALKVAQTVLEESELPAGEIVLISDFQDNGWTGDEGVRLPPGTVVTPVNVAQDVEDNVLIADVGLTREALSGRERVTPTARLLRRGGDGPRDVEVALELDGQEIQTRSVRLEADGAGVVAFQPFTLSQPHTRGTVRVPEDGLAADDARHFVLSPGTALGVVVIEGTRSGRESSLYLRRALEISDDARFQVRVRRQDAVRPADLTDAAVVILNDARLDGGSAERLRAFVEAGGGLLVVAGQSATWPASAADLLPGRLGPIEDRAEGRGGRLGYLEYAHPVFEAFSGPRSGDFTGARFFRARQLQIADSARALARFDDGSIALAEQRLGRGTVLVWTSTLDSFWNDLALQPVYLPFAHRLTEYLSGRGDAMPWFTAGQVVDLADPEALETAGLASLEAAGLQGGEDAVALTPSGRSVPLPAGDMGPRYLPLEERGFYTVRPPGTEPDRPFVLAVNVDLTESALGRLDPEELTAQIVAPAAGPEEGPGFTPATALQREDQERRQSIWRYLMVGAFALLVLETALSNWVSRREGGTPGFAGV
jgi:hypothetical protein